MKCRIRLDNNVILKRFGEKEQAGRDVFADQWTVSEKIEMQSSVRHAGTRPAVEMRRIKAANPADHIRA